MGYRCDFGARPYSSSLSGVLVPSTPGKTHALARPTSDGEAFGNRSKWRCRRVKALVRRTTVRADTRGDPGGKSGAGTTCGGDAIDLPMRRRDVLRRGPYFFMCS